MGMLSPFSLPPLVWGVRISVGLNAGGYNNDFACGPAGRPYLAQGRLGPLAADVPHDVAKLTHPCAVAGRGHLPQGGRD